MCVCTHVYIDVYIHIYIYTAAQATRHSAKGEARLKHCKALPSCVGL